MIYQRAKIVAGFGDVVDDSTTSFSLIAANSTNQTLVKKGAGVLVSIHAINVNAAVRYLKLYDTSSQPTAGTGTPIRRYAIPGNAAGAGFVIQPPIPMRFTQGIAFTLTTGVADTDTTALTANDVVLTMEFI